MCAFMEATLLPASVMTVCRLRSFPRREEQTKCRALLSKGLCLTAVCSVLKLVLPPHTPVSQSFFLRGAGTQVGEIMWCRSGGTQACHGAEATRQEKPQLGGNQSKEGSSHFRKKY